MPIVEVSKAVMPGSTMTYPAFHAVEFIFLSRFVTSALAAASPAKGVTVSVIA